MTIAQIEKKAKLVTGKDGRPVEVILPYQIYKHLLEIEESVEIFKSRETQESIKRAKEDIRHGRSRSFKNIKDATEWLDK